MADLSVELCGLRLRNPILPAAGPPGRDAEAIASCAEGGAGGLVAKTVSVRAADVPWPNMAEIHGGMLNTELWSELPLEQWLEREYPLARRAADAAGLPLVVSLGYSAEDVAALAPQIAPFADAVELSTHYVGEESRPMVEAIAAAKDALDVPVFVKLSPLGRDMSRAAELAQAAGADGIAAINSFGPCLSIDVETGLARLGGANGYGWLSGPALKPLAVRCVLDIARAVDIPIVGVGGVARGVDAVELIMAGASAVGVCTAAILRGPGVFGRIARELDGWLDAHGYRSVEEIRGLALRRAWPEPKPRVPELDEALCNGCGLCETSCVYDAIHVHDKLAALDEERCFGCGLCVTRCRPGALSWSGVEPLAGGA